MLQARLANGLFPPSVYAKDEETKLCKMCKVPCTQVHRDMECPARYFNRRQFGLPIPILNEALRCTDDPIWSRCIVPDPTLAFPSPSIRPARWTIAEMPDAPILAGNGYGDGSRINLCGLATAMASFGVVQIGGSPYNPHVVNCLISPLNYPLQDIPPAELAAMVTYVQNAMDCRTLTYNSDCDWVTDGFKAGPGSTTMACHTCADLWREFWAAQDARTFSIEVRKVKAHSKLTDLKPGSVKFVDREGNCLADAAAKAGLEMCGVGLVAIDNARRLRSSSYGTSYLTYR